MSLVSFFFMVCVFPVSTFFLSILLMFVFFLGHGHGDSHGGNGHIHLPQDEIVVIDTESGIAKQNGNVGGTKEITTKSKKHKSKNMNMHGVFLHVLADALGSVIVIISALIVLYTDWSFNIYVDPSLSVIMVVIISYSTLPLCKFTLFLFVFNF